MGTLDLSEPDLERLVIDLTPGRPWTRQMEFWNDAQTERTTPPAGVRLVWMWQRTEVEWPAVAIGDHILGWTKTAAEVDALLAQVGGAHLRARVDLIDGQGVRTPWTAPAKVRLG